MTNTQAIVNVRSLSFFNYNTCSQKLSNLLSFSVFPEGYSRNVSCAHNYISTLLSTAFDHLNQMQCFADNTRILHR